MMHCTYNVKFLLHCLRGHSQDRLIICEEIIQFLGLQKYRRTVMNHDIIRIDKSEEQEFL
jgi:hypothetical protein